MPDGFLDTNLFLHAQANDRHSEECRRFLTAVEHGVIHARLEPLVLHELSYALPHYVKQMTRAQIAEYLGAILAWPGVEGDKGAMTDAVERWAQTPGLAFVDAYLAALAARDGCPIYTMNVRELAGQGVDVPCPLPDPPR